MAIDLESQPLRQPAPSIPLTLPNFEVPVGLRFLLRTTELRVYRVPIEGESGLSIIYKEFFIFQNMYCTVY